MKRKRLFLAGAVAGALAILFWPEGAPVRYPELAKANVGVEAMLRKEWPAESGGRLLDDPDFGRAAERARSLGDAAALPALKLLVEEYGTRSREVFRSSGYWDDDRAEPLFAWLAELRQAMLNRVLIRILEDSEAHPELRRGAAIALSWPGNRGALVALSARALDRQEDHELRRAILYRLPRLELPAPPALRELLRWPFGDLDMVAAATLALLGDIEAPSLILDGLRQPETSRHLGREFLVQAAARITGREFDPRSTLPPMGPKEPEPWASHLEEWLREHPESLETDFERERREYLSSARRKRELALNSLEDILAARNEDLDFASASLLLFQPKWRESVLERLNRLAGAIGKRLEGIGDAQEKIRLLNSLLLHRKPSIPSYPESDSYESFLPFVLSYDAGNCLGYVSLYLAMAERLGIPLHGVLAPKHIFLRYDDGGFRRNIETTEGGIEREDRGYDGRAGHRIPPEAIGKGVFLANCTKREVLGAVMVNLAWAQVREGSHARVIEGATTSIRLDPKAYLAYLNRAQATFESRLGAEEEVLADLGRTLDLHPLCSSAWASRVLFLSRLDRHEEALRAAESAPAVLSGEPEILVAKADCFSRLGRHQEALSLLEEGMGKDTAGRKDDWPLLKEFQARKDPGRAEAILAGEPPDVPAPFCHVAQALLEPARGGTPEAARALAILDRIQRLMEQQSITRVRVEKGVPVRFHDPIPRALARDYHLLRGQALLLLGRKDDARTALAAAENIGPVSRDLLILRRDLQ